MNRLLFSLNQEKLKMAFEEIVKGKWEKKRAAVDRVRLSEGGGGARGTAVINISGDIVKKLGSPAFVRIGVGTGEHAGKLLIREAGMKTQNTYRLSRSKTSPNSAGSVCVSVNKLRLKKFGETKSYELAHQATDEGLVIVAPSELVLGEA